MQVNSGDSIFDWAVKFYQERGVESGFKCDDCNVPFRKAEDILVIKRKDTDECAAIIHPECPIQKAQMRACAFNAQRFFSFFFSKEREFCPICNDSLFESMANPHIIIPIKTDFKETLHKDITLNTSVAARYRKNKTIFWSGVLAFIVLVVASKILCQNSLDEKERIRKKETFDISFKEGECWGLFQGFTPACTAAFRENCDYRRCLDNFENYVDSESCS